MLKTQYTNLYAEKIISWSIQLQMRECKDPNISANSYFSDVKNVWKNMEHISSH